MQLRDVIARLEQFDEYGIICARRPWSESSEAQVVAPDEDLAVPASVKAAGFSYFLEVHVALEVLGILADKQGSLADQVRLLIHYAEHDAYPDWVYDL